MPFGPRTEADHLEMMRHADRWPMWPYLPLKNRRRKCEMFPDMSATGIMLEGDSGAAKPTVYLGVLGLGDIREWKVEEYASLEAVLLAGWEVD